MIVYCKSMDNAHFDDVYQVGKLFGTCGLFVNGVDGPNHHRLVSISEAP